MCTWSHVLSFESWQDKEETRTCERRLTSIRKLDVKRRQMDPTFVSIRSRLSSQCASQNRVFGAFWPAKGPFEGPSFSFGKASCHDIPFCDAPCELNSDWIDTKVGSIRRLFTSSFRIWHFRIRRTPRCGDAKSTFQSFHGLLLFLHTFLFWKYLYGEVYS